MKLANQYDVICAGGGFSSYLCAALLAKTGKKVLLIDEEIKRKTPGGAALYFDPDFLTLAGDGETTALGKSLSELGITTNLQSSENIIQVLTSKYRVKFGSDKKKTADDLKRELIDSGAGVADFFELLAKASSEIPNFVFTAMSPGQVLSADTQAWKKYWGSFFARIKSDKPIALQDGLDLKPLEKETADNLAAAILGTLTYSAPINLGCEQVFRGLTLALQGQSHFLGGVAKLNEKLAKIVCDSGGDIKFGSRVESLVARKGVVEGVHLSSFEGVIQSKMVVLGSRLHRLYMTLPDEFREASVMRGLRRVVPSSWRFTLSINVRSKVIPIGATSTMAYVGSFRYPLEEENFLKIQIVPSEVKIQASESDSVTVLLTTLVPYRSSSMNYSYLRKLSGKMLRVLAETMPFLEDNILSIYPDFRNDDLQLKEAYPFDGVDWIPESLMQYYIRGHRSSQDFWGPSWTTPHRNLYFAGRCIWPSLGVYGEALAARKIFEDISRPSN